MGGHLCSSSNCRRVPARMNRSWNRSVGKMDPRLTAVTRQRIRMRSIATVHAVATVEIDRGRQYKNTKSRRNLEIQSQSHSVNGITALVTTPLRLLVTRAPSGQTSRAPGVRLSQGLLLFCLMPSIRAYIPAHRAPLDAAPPLAREFDARVTVAGKAWGLSGQLAFSRQALPGIQSGLKIAHHGQDFVKRRHITIKHFLSHGFIIGLPSGPVGLCRYQP